MEKIKRQSIVHVNGKNKKNEPAFFNMIYIFMKKRILLFLTIAIFLTTTGLGCKGLSQEELASVKPISIEYWTIFDDVSLLRKFAQEYKQLRPHVTINIRQVRYNEFDDLLLNALADDVAPNIASMHVRWLPRYVGRLSPMPPAVSVTNLVVTGKYAKETSVETVVNPLPSIKAIETNFIKTVAKDINITGNVYGLPLSVDSLAVYYNKDLLDSAGIAIPPTTWGELLDATQKTTKFDSLGNIIQSGIALGTGENIGNSPDILAALFLQNGIPVVQNSSVAFASSIEKNLEEHPAYQALRFYTDFARPTKEAYTWNSTLGDSLDAFTGGRAAFYIGFAYEASNIQSWGPQLNLSVIPLPQLNPGDPKNIANYWVQSVVGKSDNKDTAWDFIRFITTPEKIKEYTDKTKRLTPLRSQVADQAKDEILGPFTTTLLTAENWYRGFDMDTAQNAMKSMIDQFLSPYGDVDPYKRDVAIIRNASSIVQQTL